MNSMISLSASKSYIYSQFHRINYSQHVSTRLFITISRQAGAGGISVAERLVWRLSEHDHPLDTSRPWTVYDTNLVQVIIHEHHLPRGIADYMPEDKISEIDDMFETLLGLHPSEWTLVHKTADTILKLANLGNAIIVGRAGNIVTRQLPAGLHVHLVSSLEKRARHFGEYYRVDKKSAREMVLKDDRSRADYVKKYYGRDINDPLLYDLTINTEQMTYDDAASVIRDAAINLRQAMQNNI